MVIALAASSAGPTPAPAADDLPPLYHAAGQDSWDFWFLKEGGVYYAYYLQSPIDQPVRFRNSTIGLATSRDLVHWTEVGEVLRANPPGTWNDGWCATGSIMRLGNGTWKMIFTGHTYTGRRGIAAATSTDLVHWTREGAGGPLPIAYRAFRVPVSEYWQSRGFTADTFLSYEVLADPYVMPDPIDGWYYMVVSGLLRNEPSTTRGCVGLLRSRDGDAWEDVGIVSAPRLWDQNEAPAIWKHGNHWYLTFGAARVPPNDRATMVFIADTMYGPFEQRPWSEMRLPNWTKWFYVAKVITGPRGDDVLLGGVGGILSRPYPVVYGADGSITLEDFTPIEPVATSERVVLRAPTPNPGHGETSIDYEVPKAGPVAIEIHDLAGRRVRTLVSGHAAAGTWRARWDGQNDHGHPTRPGVYLVRMRAAGIERSQRVVLAPR